MKIIETRIYKQAQAVAQQTQPQQAQQAQQTQPQQTIQQFLASNIDLKDLANNPTWLTAIQQLQAINPEFAQKCTALVQKAVQQDQVYRQEANRLQQEIFNLTFTQQPQAQTATTQSLPQGSVWQ